MKPLYTDTEDPGILTAKGVSIYAAVSTVYIIASDLLLDSLTITATAQLYIGVAKGIVFVLLTGTLLGYVLYRVNTVIRKNELTFRTVADNLKDVIYVFDSKKKKLHYINKAVETVLGYDTSLYYRDPEAIFSIIHPQDKDALYRIWSEIDMPDGLSEMTWIKRSGEEVRIEYQASLVSGGNAHGRTIVGIARDITERHRHIEQIARAERSQEALLKQLKSLHTIDKLITAYTPLETVYSVILHQALYTLDVDAAAILRSREPAHRLEAAAIDGFLASTKTEMNLAFDEGCVGECAVTRTMQFASGIQNPDSGFVRYNVARTEGFNGYACAPLIARGTFLGILEIYTKSGTELSGSQKSHIGALAEQTAIAIDSISSFKNLQITNERLYNAYDANISGWSRALDYRDKETEGHSRRVTDIAVALAQKAGISEEMLKYVRWGALLHDIGKMGIPDSILLKPGKLNADEWELMKRHPITARDLLSPIVYLHPAIDIPYCHHEKWDGTGYPRGLSGEDIPLAARIFAIADIWDTLRSDRPYRAGWPEEKVIEHMRSLAGTHLDPDIVKLFLLQYTTIDACRDYRQE